MGSCGNCRLIEHTPQCFLHNLGRSCSWDSPGLYRLWRPQLRNHHLTRPPRLTWHSTSLPSLHAPEPFLWASQLCIRFLGVPETSFQRDAEPGKSGFLRASCSTSHHCGSLMKAVWAEHGPSPRFPVHSIIYPSVFWKPRCGFYFQFTFWRKSVPSLELAGFLKAVNIHPSPCYKSSLMRPLTRAKQTNFIFLSPSSTPFFLLFCLLASLSLLARGECEGACGPPTFCACIGITLKATIFPTTM